MKLDLENEEVYNLLISLKNKKIDILKLHRLDCDLSYECDGCTKTEFSCGTSEWNFTDGKNQIHVCPPCALKLSSIVYFEKMNKEVIPVPHYYAEESE